ncbi:protein FAM228B isoform X2 [Apteryx rowi]|uniref:protein FAM228B isoform X2 n=1 Tax=Apteryx rowi TaxID=308060 RepID=UPI000E1D68E6|nr:protein FAM228B isoform X2 [Apteryx rowi]
MRRGAASPHSDLPPGPPGASPEPLVQGITASLSQKKRSLSTLNGRKPAKDGLKQEPLAPWQRFSSVPAKSSTANNSACSTCFGKKNSTRDWLTQKDFRHVKAVPDESRDIIACARSILERENYFVREVDRYLRHNDFLNLRKKEILYKKWLGDVSEPLLQKIEDKVDSKSSEEIRKRNEEQLSLYLNYCKKKVSIPTLQDPLLKDMQRKFTEKRIIKQCETGRLCSSRELNELSKAELPLLPLSRQRMDAVEWLKIPHGYIASEVHQTKRRKVVEHHKDGKSSCHLSSS